METTSEVDECNSEEDVVSVANSGTKTIIGAQNDIDAPSLDSFNQSASDLIAHMERLKIERIMRDDDALKKENDDNFASIQEVCGGIDSALDFIAQLNKRSLENTMESIAEVEDIDVPVTNDYPTKSAVFVAGAFRSDNKVNEEEEDKWNISSCPKTSQMIYQQEDVSYVSSSMNKALITRSAMTSGDDSSFEDDEEDEDPYMHDHVRIGKRSSEAVTSPLSRQRAQISSKSSGSSWESIFSCASLQDSE